MKLKDKLDTIFENFDDSAEGANYHDFVGVARSVFDSVKEFVPSKDHEAIAKNICTALEIF